MTAKINGNSKTHTPIEPNKSESVEKPRRVKQQKATTEISNCNFTGIHWDAKAVDSITQIASACGGNAIALQRNAETLAKLAEVLKSSNVSMGPMVYISDKE